MILPKLRSAKSVTILELLISIVFIAMLVLGIYSIEQFSNSQVVSAQRRSEIQNNLAYALEHMNKYIQKGIGDLSGGHTGAPPSPAIETSGTGFRIWYDCDNTPGDVSNDSWVRYRLSPTAGRTYSLEVDSGGACSIPNEYLTKNIITNFTFTVYKDNTAGTSGNSVEVNLTGKYDPTSGSTLAINPQIEMKAKMACNSVSTN